MKNWKKPLSLLLALVLLLGGVAVGAAAMSPTPSNQSPAFTRLTATWNGTIEICRITTLQPSFTPANVALVAYCAQGEPHALNTWQDFQVTHRFNQQTGVVTFTVGQLQASFAFPVNFLELYINNLSYLPELVLNEPSPHRGFSRFTPPTSQWYRFVGPVRWIDISVINANFEVIAHGFGALYAELEAGETYFVVSTYVTVTRSSSPHEPPPCDEPTILSVWQRLLNWIQRVFGWFMSII